MARSGPRWRRPVVLAIIAAFLLIEALGLCNTFGQLTLA
jgi:ABC-type maltose transport system permease subunit